MIKWTHDKYENELFIKEINSIPLEKYNGYDTLILHQCIKGHKTMRSPNNVLRKMSCTVCAGNNKIGHSEYLNKLLAKNISHIPVDLYINTDTPIMHKCKKSHQWLSAPKNILEGRECPACADITGFYCTSFFNNHPDIANKPGILYCVVLVNKNTMERVCIKIGITKGTSNKDVLNRVGHFKGYDTRIQKLVFGTLEEVYYLEQYLHDLWDHKRYISEWKFGGYKELFQLDNEIVKSIPDSI